MRMTRNRRILMAVSMYMDVIRMMVVFTVFFFPMDFYRNVGSCNTAFHRWFCLNFYAGKSDRIYGF